MQIAGSLSTSVLWKLSPGKLPFPRTLNNIDMDIFNILSQPRYIWDIKENPNCCDGQTDNGILRGATLLKIFKCAVQYWDASAFYL